MTRPPDAATDERRELVRPRNRLVADFGDLGRIRNAAALAAYVGVVPGLKKSQAPRSKRPASVRSATTA